MAHHELLPLIGLLVTNARLWALVEQGADTWGSLLDALPNVVAAVRDLASGKTIEVPYVAGFRGASLSAGVEVSLSSGLLCAPRPADCSFLLPNAKEVTLVLVGRYPLRLAGVSPKKSADEIPDFSADWRSLQAKHLQSERVVDLTRLAVLLASPQGEAWGLSQISSLVVDPTSAGGSPRAGNFEDVSRSAQIDSEGAVRIEGWWSRVRDDLPGALDIAMRRMLNAAGRRSDPVDGFVDSVVAWENCFGTKQETMFRVTGAIAALLEPSLGESRLAMQKELKELYNKRSEVVHGKIHLQTEDAYAFRDQALQIAIRCLRGLLVDRPELLKETESAVRSTQLMLG